MRFHQVMNEELGCASYLLADSGEAIVVDPRWDVDVYLELASNAGARIVHVVETHDHADHVSGRGRLVRRTGAQAHQPHHAGEPGSPGLRCGDEVRAGRICMRAIATPGHRPEHLSLLVSDGERDVDGWCLLAGDSLLVGDVARPDLAVAAQDGARDLHASVQRILALGDHVELWPAHVGGSLCGGRLSAKTSSTIGFERRAQPATELCQEDFVSAVAGRTPPRPPNVARIVALNQGPLDAEPAEPAILDAAGVRDAVARGATVLDVRPVAEFDSLHLQGALALGTGANRATRAGWAVDPEEPLLVIGRDVADAQQFAAALHAVGLWSVEGVAAGDGAAWRAVGCPVGTAAAWSVDALARALGAGRLRLIDVREHDEYEAGHVPGSVSVPLHELRDGRGIVSVEDGPLAVACATGPRAAFAASLLRRAGHRDVVRVAGGGVRDLAALGVRLATADASLRLAA